MDRGTNTELRPTVNQAIQCWIDELNNPLAEKRGDAAEQLGRLARSGSLLASAVVPALIRGLRDDDRVVRWWSAFGLGAGKDSTAAVAALIAALTDADHEIRDAAAFSLQFFLS